MDSHAVMAAEIVRLTAINRELRAALERISSAEAEMLDPRAAAIVAEALANSVDFS